MLGGSNSNIVAQTALQSLCFKTVILVHTVFAVIATKIFINVDAP